MPGGFSLRKFIDIILSGQYAHEDDPDRVLTEAYGEYGGTLEEELERYFAERPLIQALVDIIDSRRRLIAMARDLSGDMESCPDEATREQAALVVLKTMGAPILPPPEQRRGIWTILQELRNIKDDLSEGDMDHGTPSMELRKYPLDGWTYVEHVLKVTIRFYTLALGPDMGEEFRAIFQNARGRRSLRPILQGMQGLQKRFIDPRDGSVARQKCKQILGRESPFAGFDILKYDNLIDEYRNFFAHSVADAIKEEGVSRVRKSIAITIDLIEDLLGLRIAPALIFPTARGQDAYGRKIVWFIRERQIDTSNWLIPSISDNWVYKDWERLGENGLQLLHAYLCPSPINNGIFDPLMFSMDEVNDEG